MFKLSPPEIPELEGVIKVYPTWRSFAAHVRKHMLHGEEAQVWHRVLRADKPGWKAIKAYTKEERVKSPTGEARAFYDALCDYADGAVQYAAGQPSILVIESSLRAWDAEQHRVTHWLLSRDGAILCIRDGAIRTMFFDTSKKDLSQWKVYRQGIQKLHYRGLNAEAGIPRLLENEHCWSFPHRVHWHKKENFSNERNPFERKKSTSKKKRPKHREVYHTMLGNYIIEE